MHTTYLCISLCAYIKSLNCTWLSELHWICTLRNKRWNSSETEIKKISSAYLSNLYSFIQFKQKKSTICFLLFSSSQIDLIKPTYVKQDASQKRFTVIYLFFPVTFYLLFTYLFDLFPYLVFEIRSQDDDNIIFWRSKFYHFL